jgi:hypothetical protein
MTGDGKYHFCLDPKFIEFGFIAPTRFGGIIRYEYDAFA